MQIFELMNQPIRIVLSSYNQLQSATVDDLLEESLGRLSRIALSVPDSESSNQRHRGSFKGANEGLPVVSRCLL